MMRKFLTHLLSMIVLGCTAQELPRRVFLGIRMENVTDDMRRIIGIGETKAVLVSEVLPNSSAEKAGWQRGDLLLSINGTPVGSTAEVIDLLAGQSGEKPYTYVLLRDKKEVKGKSTFTGWREEQYADLALEYTAVKAAAGIQRMIITRPKAKAGIKLPVVVFITGIGCYSVDTPLDTARAETQLLNTLARKGYACVRVEKPGIGDGATTSKRCADVSFMEDLDAYVQAVNKLKQRADIDSGNVILIGHSMGGLMAPMVAQRTPIQRIIAFGTIGSSFIEYLAKTRRTIGEAYGMSPEETDDLIRDYCECATWYFADHLTTEEAAKKKPACREYLGVLDYRSRAYNDELYALNIPGVWKEYGGKALLLWGESDYISARDDHAILAGVVNHYHRGHAEFITVPQTDHGMNSAADFKSAQAAPGGYNPHVAQVILTWLQRPL